MQEECSDSPPQWWSAVWINISTLGLCLLIRAVISTHATLGRQALMMLVPPCPAKAFPQRHTPKSQACELWDKTLTALESVAHVSFSVPRTKSNVSHQQAPKKVMASLVWSQLAWWKTIYNKKKKFSTLPGFENFTFSTQEVWTKLGVLKTTTNLYLCRE